MNTCGFVFSLGILTFATEWRILVHVLVILQYAGFCLKDKMITVIVGLHGAQNVSLGKQKQNKANHIATPPPSHLPQNNQTTSAKKNPNTPPPPSLFIILIIIAFIDAI